MQSIEKAELCPLRERGGGPHPRRESPGLVYHFSSPKQFHSRGAPGSGTAASCAPAPAGRRGNAIRHFGPRRLQTRHPPTLARTRAPGSASRTARPAPMDTRAGGSWRARAARHKGAARDARARRAGSPRLHPPPRDVSSGLSHGCALSPRAPLPEFPGPKSRSCSALTQKENSVAQVSPTGPPRAELSLEVQGEDGGVFARTFSKVRKKPRESMIRRMRDAGGASG